MLNPPCSVRRSAGAAAAAVGVSSLVTGSLLFVAAPASADSERQPGGGNAPAPAALGKPSDNPSPGGPSAQKQHAEQLAGQPADQQAGQRRGLEAHVAQELTAHGTSPQGDAGQSAADRPAPEQASPDGSAAAAPATSGQHNESRPGPAERGKSAAADRPGNQGTIKIDAVEFDTHPNNEPHVGCTFQVDFYNYGQGDYFADVNFAQHPPTPGDLRVTSGNPGPAIGGDPPGGGTDLDAEETYQLSFSGDPHPKQGYHVKLTIHAPDSLGADTKHKVFWVQPCEETPPPTDDESTPPPTDDEETTPPTDDESTPPTDDESTPPTDDESTPPTDDESTPPGGVDESTPPGHVGTTPPAGGETTPPADEQTGGVPPLPGAAAGGGSSSGAAVALPPAGVPTSVDAGLTGNGPADEPPSAATVLAGLGGLLLAAAGVLGRRRRGEHQV